MSFDNTYQDFELNFTHDLIALNPEAIEVKRIEQSALVKLQSEASKAVWRPAPGRKNSFVVLHDNVAIGVFFLASPVINLGVRDKHLNLSGNPSEKGTQLRSIADMSVCVGLQPLSWHWNVGKLVALLATSVEVSQFWESKYGDSLDWITTTSLYGRGAQYNRVYKFLGYTKGYGHHHITEERYQEMLTWMRENDVEIPSSSFGAGSNPRMRRINAYSKASGEKINLLHGDKRGVYVQKAGENSTREIINHWFERWGEPRYLRTKDLTPPYLNGKS